MFSADTMEVLIAMQPEILTLIQKNMNTFSKSQKLIANFIINHYEKASFMTASKLGKTVSVSESTVVRFATELGYNGYPHMQKTLQEMIRNKLTSIQRIEVANELMGEDDIIKSVLQSDIEKIRTTMDEMDNNSFNAAVSSILKARRVYIIGVRSSAALAGFLGFYFNLMFENVTTIISTSVSEIFEKILHVNTDDVVIGISFPRYSANTHKAMQYAKKKDATVIALTDGLSSPLSSVADFSLFAKSDIASFVDSLVAPLSLINALIVAVGREKQRELETTFEALEQIWDEYSVYEKTNDF